MNKIHVGFLVSYDYDKLKNSIPAVYNQADAIFLALDAKQLTWSGNNFNINPSFFDWLKTYDVDKKISLYKDDFYVADLTAIENETRERYMLSQKMGIGNWLVQVDADEIFIDFSDFVSKLKKYDRFLINPEKQPVQIAGFLLNIYKYVDGGILYVNNISKVLLATNYPNYKVARKTKERIIYVNSILLHECLSRTEAELRFKLDNWGHNVDVHEGFFEKWLKVNKHNYKSMQDFFYIEPHKWKRLGFFESQDLKKIKIFLNDNPNLKLSKFYLFSKNFGQWFKYLKFFKKPKKAYFEAYFNKMPK